MAAPEKVSYEVILPHMTVKLTQAVKEMRHVSVRTVGESSLILPKGTFFPVCPTL